MAHFVVNGSNVQLLSLVHMAVILHKYLYFCKTNWFTKKN